MVMAAVTIAAVHLPVRLVDRAGVLTLVHLINFSQCCFA